MFLKLFNITILSMFIVGCASMDSMDEPSIGNYFFASVMADRLANGEVNRTTSTYYYRRIGVYPQGILYAKSTPIGKFKGAIFVVNDKIVKVISSDELAELLDTQRIIEKNKMEIVRQQKLIQEEKLEAENLENIRKRDILNLNIARNKAEMEKLLNSKEYKLIYEKDDFSILEKNRGLIYLKSGINVSEADVAKDISYYKYTILNQQNFERRLQENLSRNWFVTAQGKNRGNLNCSVVSINSKGRDENGNAIFNISTQCRSPTGSGTSGSSNIICGIDRQKNHSHTSFNAQCQ